MQVLLERIKSHLEGKALPTPAKAYGGVLAPRVRTVSPADASTPDNTGAGPRLAIVSNSSNSTAEPSGQRAARQGHGSTFRSRFR